MRSALTTTAICCLVLTAHAVPANPPCYSITDLGAQFTADEHPGFRSLALNNRGVVIGSVNTGKYKHNDSIPAYHAGLWKRGTFRDLDTLSGFATADATAINDRDQVVGTLHEWRGSEDVTSDGHAFLWQNGVMRDLGALHGDKVSDAQAVNNSGEIVGSSTLSVMPPLDALNPTRAVLWRRDGMSDLGTFGGDRNSEAVGINDRGQIVVNAAQGVFLRQKGRARRLDRLPRGARAVCVNNNAEVLCKADGGLSRDGEQRQAASLWSRGKVRPLGAPRGCPFVEPAGLNNRGQVVGWASDANGNDRAFLWKNGRLFDLSRGQPGWVLQQAQAINDRGQIVGFGLRHGHQRAFLLTPR